MRETLVKYFNGSELTVQEVVVLLEAYMNDVNKKHPTLIQNMLNHPMAHMLLQKALGIAAEHLKEKYTITSVYNKEGHRILVY